MSQAVIKPKYDFNDRNARLSDPKMKARLVEVGRTELAGTAADFGKLIAEETEKWAKVVKSSGAKAE